MKEPQIEAVHTRRTRRVHDCMSTMRPIGNIQRRTYLRRAARVVHVAGEEHPPGAVQDQRPAVVRDLSAARRRVASFVLSGRPRSSSRRRRRSQRR